MPSDRRRSREPRASDVGIVVPIRSFRLGKARLAGAVHGTARSDLARELATRVLDATAGLPVAVVTSDDEVAAWAGARTAPVDVLPDPGSLDGAATAGVRWATEGRYAHVVVVHADLPLLRSLAPVLDEMASDAAVVVPCHRDDGTPVLAVPTAAGFRFAYGPGSFARHVDEARRVGLRAVVVDHDPALRFDVDLADDVERWRAQEPRPA